MIARASSDLVGAVEHRWSPAIDAALAAQVVGLLNDSIRTENVLGFCEPLTPEEGRRIVAKIDGAVRNGEKHFFGVHHGEQLIGMALLTPNQLPNCRHIVEWSKGIIRSDCRRHGVLRGAVHAMASRCVEMGWEIVTLDVRAGTRQHRLWAMLGFREYGTLPDYARIAGTTHAGAFMFAAAQKLVEATRS
jgi:hypothetical protein